MRIVYFMLISMVILVLGSCSPQVESADSIVEQEDEEKTGVMNRYAQKTKTEETTDEFNDELYKKDEVEYTAPPEGDEEYDEQPIVANREAVEKSLEPNKDNVIMIDWNITNDVKLDQCFHEELGDYYYCPEFGSIMKSLEGKTVALAGYILPLEDNYFVLSMKPMASCFFCGGSGPQSIVDLKFKGPRAFKMDTYLTFKGKLRLNASNLDELFYILDYADVYEEPK